MHYAVQLQKIELGEGRVFFKPLNLIKGEYLEYDEIFIDERGFEYWFMKDSEPNYERYFCCPTTIKELKKTYADQLTESEILDEFLSNFFDICFLGYYDELEGTTKVIEFDFYDIENQINNMSQKQSEELEEDHIQFDPENNEKFIFSLQALKELREYQTVEEVRTYIDKLIYAGNYINEVMQKTMVDDHFLDNKNFILEWETPYTTLGIKEKQYSKKELLDIVKNCINKIQVEDLDDKDKNIKIDYVLDAYNYLIKETFQKTKKLR